MDDPGNLFLKLLLLLVLILVNAFFAMSEIAVISLNDAKIDKMAEEGHKKAKKVVKLTENSAAFLSTIQIGVTLAGFLTSASASPNLCGKNSEPPLFPGSAPFGQSHAGFLKRAFPCACYRYHVLFFPLCWASLCPRELPLKTPKRCPLRWLGCCFFVKRIMRPFIALLSASTNLCVRLLGIDPGSEPENVTEEEIRMMVDVGEEKGVIEESQEGNDKQHFRI